MTREAEQNAAKEESLLAVPYGNFMRWHAKSSDSIESYFAHNECTKSYTSMESWIARCSPNPTLVHFTRRMLH
jgi:hypothetical protein